MIAAHAVVILLAMAQVSRSPPLSCGIDTQAVELDLTSCYLSEIPVDEIQKVEGITNLRLSKNYLEKVDPNSFAGLAHLQQVDFSYNPFLIVPNDTCFLVSESIILINLSYSDVEVIHSASLKCLPNLKDIILWGNRNCEKTETLLQKKKNVHVHCKRDPQIVTPKATDARTDQHSHTDNSDDREGEKKDTTPTQGTNPILNTSITAETPTGKTPYQPKDVVPKNNGYIWYIVLGVIGFAVACAIIGIYVWYR